MGESSSRNGQLHVNAVESVNEVPDDEDDRVNYNQVLFDRASRLRLLVSQQGTVYNKAPVLPLPASAPKNPWTMNLPIMFPASKVPGLRRITPELIDIADDDDDYEAPTSTVELELDLFNNITNELDEHFTETKFINEMVIMNPEPGIFSSRNVHNGNGIQSAAKNEKLLNPPNAVSVIRCNIYNHHQCLFKV